MEVEHVTTTINGGKWKPSTRIVQGRHKDDLHLNTDLYCVIFYIVRHFRAKVIDRYTLSVKHGHFYRIFAVNE
jgi:hypothetical protein